MRIEDAVTIDAQGVPLTVTSTGMCPNLNAQYLGGLDESAFSRVGHSHDAGAIVSGYIGVARLGTGSPSSATALFGDGQWRQIQSTDISATTEFGRRLINKADDASARSYIGAAAIAHTHTAVDVTSGTFTVERLGSGSSSATHVLCGNSNSTQAGQWRVLGYADVSSAVGRGTSTIFRVPYWSSSGVLSDSPLVVGGSSVTTDSDFGTNGNVTCTDLVVNYASATQLKSSIYSKVKSTLQGSGSVSVSANDGAQTLTLTASSGLPSVPGGSDGPYVLVKSGGAYSWQKLVGDGAGVS